MSAVIAMCAAKYYAAISVRSIAAERWISSKAHKNAIFESVYNATSQITHTVCKQQNLQRRCLLPPAGACHQAVIYATMLGAPTATLYGKPSPAHATSTK